MKKTYIIPSIAVLSYLSGSVCQVGSIGGGLLEYGGPADPDAPDPVSPM